MKKSAISLALTLFLTFAVGCGGTPQTNAGSNGSYDKRGLDAFEYSLLSLTGTDEVGRTVETADGRKDKKAVGLFYSLWLGQHGVDGIYDVQALLATEEGRAALATDSALSREGQFHFCSQPLYGYYKMTDPWVVTRHVELLTMAGIDYLCFDATNSVLYQNPTELVLDTLLKYQKQGWDVPKAMFYTNTASGTTVSRIYNLWYSTDKYDDIWWEPNGKPQIIGITEDNANASDQTKYGGGTYSDFVTEEMQAFFDVKESQWPNGEINHNAIPWMSWQYPQIFHQTTKTVSVSVAQHSASAVAFSAQHPESSRGYDYKTGVVYGSWQKGQNFQNEWETVFDYGDKVENVFVTSWNEWMAIKNVLDDGFVRFVDVYNEEYSRDIEMTAGSYGDNFYMQLVENVRRYKLTDGVAYDMKKTNIDIHSNSGLVLWDYVTAKYKDFVGDAMARNHKDAAGINTYVDNSNRNDISDVRVTHDNTNLYFYVKTAEPITAYNGTDENWMNIFVSTPNAKNGFGDYDYVINRAPSANGKTTVERSTGGYNWTTAGVAEYVIYDNVMLVAVPLSALGLTADNAAVSFKVSDNVTEYDDIMNYYVTGDSAPIGRLSYQYGTAA